MIEVDKKPQLQEVSGERPGTPCIQLEKEGKRC